MSKTINGLTEDQQSDLDLIAALDEADAMTALLVSYNTGRDDSACAPTLRSVELDGVMPISRKSAGWALDHRDLEWLSLRES